MFKKMERGKNTFMSSLERLEGTCSGKLKSQMSFYTLSVKHVQRRMQKTAFRLHPFGRGEGWPYVVALEKISIV